MKRIIKSKSEMFFNPKMNTILFKIAVAINENSSP
jgi:hypothetical protein